MPLVALLDGTSRVDATAVTAEQWRSLYKTKTRQQLTCTDCGLRMHAKQSPTRLRFFAHDTKSPDCRSHGESAEHRHLKHLIATAARAAGAHVAVEAGPSTGDRSRWRADVLVTTPHGQKIAFEAQLATMTAEDGRYRTDRYAADGIETIWVTSKHAPWLHHLPGIKIESLAHPTVTRGLLGFHSAAAVATARNPADVSQLWRHRRQRSLDSVIADIVHGRVVPHTVPSFQETIPWGSFTREIVHAEPITLTTAADVWRSARAVQKELDRCAAQAQAQARRRAADHVLRYETLKTAIAEVADTNPSKYIWLGANPVLGTGDVATLLQEAEGNRWTGHGFVVAVGTIDTPDNVRAVVLPNVRAVLRSTLRNWRLDRVVLWVSANEADLPVLRAFHDHGLCRVVDDPFASSQQAA